jgi:predicted enzyme related to lactoylglutathione lyase
MPDITLNLVVLRSADLDRARRFYELLGVKFAREKHGSGPEHLACCLGGVVLELYPDTSTSGDSRVRIGFDVPSVQDAFRAILESGGTVVTPLKESPWGIRAVVADPDGHRVELIQRRS